MAVLCRSVEAVGSVTFRRSYVDRMLCQGPGVGTNSEQQPSANKRARIAAPGTTGTTVNCAATAAGEYQVYVVGILCCYCYCSYIICV